MNSVTGLLCSTGAREIIGRNEGIWIHDTTMRIDRQIADDSVKYQIDTNPDLRRCVDAWNQFKEDYILHMWGIEQPCKSKEYGYTGIVDRTCQLKDGTGAIIEIKSGMPEPWHELQLAAYAIALEEEDPSFTYSEGIIVYLQTARQRSIHCTGAGVYEVVRCPLKREEFLLHIGKPVPHRYQNPMRVAKVEDIEEPCYLVRASEWKRLNEMALNLQAELDEVEYQQEKAQREYEMEVAK